MNQKVKWRHGDLNRRPHACHAESKSLANNGNYRVHDIILTWLGAGISAVLSKRL